METTHRTQLKALFEEAIALPLEQRSWFLDQACDGEPSLRHTLDSLIAHHEIAPAFFDRLGEWVARAVREAAQASSERTVPGIPRCVSHFQIIEKLGDGGMGMVYKARDTRLDRLVALKFLLPYLRHNDGARARFVHEAKAASAFDHPNIATIYGIDTTEPAPWESEGHPFIVMAYYAGETLKQRIERGPLPVDDSLHVAFQTLRGLAKAHEHGISHRDIKPANLIVTADGLIKIVDFGLAKVAGVCLTKTGAAMGTATYMSPEQARGEPVDHRTDLWSLGVVLYEMLAGQRPFRGDYEQAVVYSIVNEDPPPLGALRSDLPSELEAIVNRCLEKDPDARYQTAVALRRDLMRVGIENQQCTITDGNLLVLGTARPAPSPSLG